MSEIVKKLEAQLKEILTECETGHPHGLRQCIAKQTNQALILLAEAIAALQPGSSREIARFETKPGADYMTGGIDLGDHANAIEIHGKTETEIRNRLEWLLRSPAPVAVTGKMVQDALDTFGHPPTFTAMRRALEAALSGQEGK